MNLQEIEVVIDKNGHVSIDVNGIEGMSCLDLTKALEAVLGGQIEAREMKSSAYQSGQSQSNRQKLQQFDQ